MAHKFASEEDFKTRKQVDQAYTDVVKIIKVDGGWSVFTDARDYEVWKGQK